jgi:TldD protein
LAVRQARELSLAISCRPAIELAPVTPRQGLLECPSGRDPRDLAVADKQAMVQAAIGALFGADRRIVDARVRYQDELLETWVVTSEGTCLREMRPEITLAVLAVAEEEGTSERALGSVAMPGPLAELDRWVSEVGRVAERAVQLLHAAPIQPARLPVVLDQRAAGVLAHRAAGHLCEAGPDAEDHSPLPIGTRVGPALLSVGDDGTALGLRGTLAFDHEGATPRNTMLVRHGVVVGHVHTRATAARAGAAATGNARGVGRDLPRPRLTNTYIANGRGELADLIQEIPLGVYIAEPVGLSLDQGRLLLRAGLARMIRHGELAEPVKGVTLAGEALAVFGQIDRVAGDFSWDRSAAGCARGAAGEVPVGMGAPHIRLIEASVGETS